MWGKCWDLLINEQMDFLNKMLEPERKRDFFENAFTQITLEAKGFELVYIDEFHVSMQNHRAYSWSKRGSPALLGLNSDPWTQSFAIAISRKREEGVLTCSNSITKKTFKWFIHDVWKKLIQDQTSWAKKVIILNNHSIHKSEEIVQYLKNNGIKAVTIPLILLN